MLIGIPNEYMVMISLLKAAYFRQIFDQLIIRKIENKFLDIKNIEKSSKMMLVYWKLPFFMDKSFCSKRQIFAEGFSHFWHAKIDTSKVYLTTPDRKLNRFMSVFARCTFCEFYALKWVKFPYLEKERKSK